MEASLGRKGHGVDTIFAIATIFGLAIFSLVIVYTYSEFVDKAENTTMNNTPQAMTAMRDIETVNEMWDYVILLIFIGFALAVMILGYFIDVHSIFFPIFVLVMLVGIGCWSAIIFMGHDFRNILVYYN